MQVLSSGKVPFNGLTSRGCVSQNFNKSLTGEIIGVFGVTGVFKGQLVGGRYKLPQSDIDPVVLTIYFHAIPARTHCRGVSFACDTRRRHPGKAYLGNMGSILPLLAAAD